MEGCRTYHSLFPNPNADCCDEFGVKFTICVLIKHTGLPTPESPRAKNLMR